MKKLKDVMSKDVKCLTPESNLKEIASKMQEHDTGAVPICENDRLVGMVTDRDIVIKTFAGGKDPATCKARDIMTSPMVYCFDDQDVDEAARLMEVKQIRRLVVLNRDKKLVGIVSLGDISTRAGEELAGEALEKISEPRQQASA